MAKPKTGRAVANYDEKWAQQATEAKKGFEAPTGKFISLKGGKMTYGGANIPNNEFNAVVLGAVYENQYFDPEQPYDSESPQSPICYAFGHEKECKDASPHENSPTPQSDACAGCDHNEFGSAEKGKGKACNNRMRLALITEDELENIATAELTFLKVPVMSVKNFQKFVTDAEKIHGRPYYGVVCRIFLEDDDKSQFRVVFEPTDKIDGDPDAVKERHEAVMKEIDFPYPEVVREPAPKKAAKKGTGKKPKFAAR